MLEISKKIGIAELEKSNKLQESREKIFKSIINV